MSFSLPFFPLPVIHESHTNLFGVNSFPLKLKFDPIYVGKLVRNSDTVISFDFHLWRLQTEPYASSLEAQIFLQQISGTFLRILMVDKAGIMFLNKGYSV
ncbi:hypothetical protein OCU04_003705 [Sclerotinia nivalis]|uniref:Uncharacterized protein n=1 Tax=Sclerotinia nivalis TaxID=352851 RepID=A0A9X0DM34_9HELO|nr:hypothetical protein OCU04_003705 [Sclerotinia nivalis]